MSNSDSDDDDLFAGAPTFKPESRAAKAKQTRTFNYLDKMVKNTVENSEKRQKIDLLMKESTNAPNESDDILFSLKIEDPDDKGTEECYDDNDERYWEKIESMAKIANETAHKRDRRRRDLEDLIDGYNLKDDDSYTLEEQEYSPSEAREKRQARIHAEQVGTTSNVGSRRIFGYPTSVDRKVHVPTFSLFQSVDEQMSALNDILRFDPKSLLDQDTKSKFEIFQEKILYPIERSLQLNVLEEGLRRKHREWSADIEYPSIFIEWLILVGISALKEESNLSSDAFHIAKTLLRKNVRTFRLKDDETHMLGYGKRSWSELSWMLHNEFGMYSSNNTAMEDDEDSSNTIDSFQKNLSLYRTLQIWDIFIEKGYMNNEDFHITPNIIHRDHSDACTVESIIRDLIVSLLDENLYNGKCDQLMMTAITNLIRSTFKQISFHNEKIHELNICICDSYGSDSDNQTSTTNWLKLLSQMVVQKISTLPNPCLPLTLANKTMPHGEIDDDLLVTFSLYLAYESLTYCFGDILQVPLANKIQRTCLAIIQDIDKDMTLDDISLRFEAIAMSEVALRELIKSDNLRSNSQKFLAIVDIAMGCEELGSKLLQKNVLNFSVKTSVGNMYQNKAEATAMFHYYDRLIDLCTALRKSITSVISDSNLRRVKELLSFLLSSCEDHKKQASILTKISDNRKNRQSSLMSFIQQPSRPGESNDSEKDDDDESD